MEARIERDLLGEMQIPKDVYYGIQTCRALANFPITQYHHHTELIKAFALVKKAAAIANCEVGLLDKKIAAAMILATDEMIQGQWHDQIVVDVIQGGAGTSLNMNVNEVVCNRALEILGERKGDYSIISPNSHVNMSQSTNDVLPTAFRIAILAVSTGLEIALESLIRELSSKGMEFDHVLKIGRTHLQDAVPIRLGQEFTSYSRLVQRDLRRLIDAKSALFELNIGATAVGTGINAMPEYVSKVVEILRNLTGYSFRSSDNLIDLTQNTDAYAQISSTLKVLALNLSKIANDMRLMASGPRAGLGEISLPSRQAGSSIMPGKVNPVMCEVLNQICFQVIGNDLTISLACEAGQLELNVMEPVVIFDLLESLSILQNGIKVFTEFAVEGIVANEEVCRAEVERSIGVVTALNPYLGYEISTAIAKEALMTGKSVRQVCLERKILNEEQLDVILDANEMTTPGVSGYEKYQNLHVSHV